MGLSLIALLLSQDGATVSFSSPHLATYPGAVEGREVLRIRIRDLPRRLDVWRAVLHLGRDEAAAFGERLKEVLVTTTREGRETPLKLLPPRYNSFDAADAVRQALEDGRTEVVFSVRSFAGYQPLLTRLDVSGGLRAKNEIPRVSDLRCEHREGQTFLTWTEIERQPGRDTATVSEFIRWRESMVVRSRRLRYRVYRADAPVSAATIRDAEFVDEVAPLSGWNLDLLGTAAGNGESVPRYSLRDGAPPVGPDTAICVLRAPQRRKSYYAVSVALDGEENLSAFGEGNVSGGLDEAPGPGAPVLQEMRENAVLLGVPGATLFRYVRWETAPDVAAPSQAFDYLVALPAGVTTPSPAGLFLHGWGGRLDRGFGSWTAAAQGAVLISAVQSPYDGWTGYHEHRGSWRSWKEGQVRPYTQERLLRFLDWAGLKHPIDRERIFAAGAGLGGGGAVSLGLEHAGRFAWTLSASGVHRPAEAPLYATTYERVFGLTEWALPAGERPAFERYDQVRAVAGAGALPLLVFSAGRKDRATGWTQARALWKALQEARLPHVFSWGRQGEGQKALPPGGEAEGWPLLVALRAGSSLPAFSNGSLDEAPGSGDPKDGDPEGQSNGHLLWDPQVVDEAGRWEAALRVAVAAPRDEAQVDVTPRRCVRFRGGSVNWRTLSPRGRELQSGSVRADAQGVVTIPKVNVTRDGIRLILENQP